MEIRRPTLKDKDAVLSMINEFLEQKSATDGLWHFNVNDFNYETWLEDSLRQEMGLSVKECLLFNTSHLMREVRLSGS